MTALYVMIIASLFIALGFLAAFIWSVKKGHYDDDYTPSVRILLDDVGASAKVTQRSTERKGVTRGFKTSPKFQSEISK